MSARSLGVLASSVGVVEVWLVWRKLLGCVWKFDGCVEKFSGIVRSLVGMLRRLVSVFESLVGVLQSRCVGKVSECM